MMYRNLVAIFSFLSLAVVCFSAKPQTPEINKSTKPVLFDGMIILGYVDRGVYINFAGPSIKFSKKPVSVLLGLVPGLRIKKDKVASGSSENSTVTPSLGFGLTAVYKHFVLQVPVYYNAKTITKNGKWHPGAGVGYKF
ncbi:hypothetical protein [Pedobacter antarcticus]|uniref:hypothetical protein n=1 Tax=Pedobacter antarcticus TaxID=34086 RepID=UPI0008805BC9|nr:hypothetical protein [Pedobacter antarcticus]SDM39466.1 hypothetical protein SAMN04488084_106135 [Pedobacter antarcticus]